MPDDGEQAVRPVTEPTRTGEKRTDDDAPLRAFSSGGGVQSTAVLVLSAQGIIDFPLHLFANVGANAENPDTIAYVRDFAKPYAALHGIQFIEVQWVDRTGRVRDLYDDLVRQEKDIPIPMRLASGAFANRKCTARYKIEVVARWLRQHGATRENPAVVGLGISTDEFSRAKTGVPKQQPWTTRTNPLLDLGLSRKDCLRVVADAGLPEPPKSSCWFCPFQGPEQWKARRRNQPGLFAKAEALEDTLNERRTALGKDRAGLASPTSSLASALDDGQLSMADCDGGWCMT